MNRGPVHDTSKMRAAQALRRHREAMLKGTSFDPACLHLAEHFLAGEGGSPGEHIGLAQHIQDAVEAWFQTRLATYASSSLRAAKASGDSAAPSTASTSGR